MVLHVGSLIRTLPTLIYSQQFGFYALRVLKKHELLSMIVKNNQLSPAPLFKLFNLRGGNLAIRVLQFQV